MLTELEQILRKQDGLEERQFQEAACELRDRQFIYAADHGKRRHYDLVVRQKDYFEELFKAFGATLIHDPARELVGVVPEFGAPMRKDETIVLLLLRHLYGEHLRARIQEDGTIPVTSDEIVASFTTIARAAFPIRISRLRAILDHFADRGLVKILSDASDGEGITIELSIRPAVLLVLKDDFTDAVIAFVDGAASQIESDESTREAADTDRQADARSTSEEQTS